jgi:hypothetical protein
MRALGRVGAAVRTGSSRGGPARFCVRDFYY